jgi:hypothetical protein
MRREARIFDMLMVTVWVGALVLVLAEAVGWVTP